MGSITYEQEITSAIPPSRLFKAFVLDGDNLVPKLLPGAFKSFQTLEGDGGAGTIKLVTLGEAGQFKSAKHRVDEIDEANHIYKYTVIEGEILGDADSISYVVRFEAGPDGGSVVKTASTYHTKKDDHNIREEIKERKEKAKALFHAVEAHLHAHPHEYN